LKKKGKGEKGRSTNGLSESRRRVEGCGAVLVPKEIMFAADPKGERRSQFRLSNNWGWFKEWADINKNPPEGKGRARLKERFSI